MHPQSVPDLNSQASAPEYAQERLELAAVLTSRTLERSPALVQLLIYLCSKYFEGTADQLRNTRSGVEILGRPHDFDPRKGSIVRVQAHRLCEHLTQYYRAEGANHGFHIVIPPGSYTPRFVFQRLPAAEVELSPQFAITAPQPAIEPTRTIRTRVIALSIAVLTAAALSFAVLAYRQTTRVHTRALPSPVAAGFTPIRIIAGIDQSWIDGFGNTWHADRFFEGGTVVHPPEQTIPGTRDPRLYQSRREGMFRYDIPLQPGSYEMRLYFAETYYGETNTAGFGGEASRAFDIVVNGKTLVRRLDIVGEVARVPPTSKFHGYQAHG